MISRDQYKKIKSMSREELNSYLDRVFAQGYNNGVTSMSAIMLDKIDQGLKNTPGIGEKRYEEILTNITAALAADEEAE